MPKPLADEFAAPCSYIVNSGISDRVAPANGLPQDYQPNGVFFDAYTPAVYRSGAVIVPATTTDLGYISIHDGATNTLMLSENIDALDWIAAWGKNTVNPLQTAPNEHTPPQLSQLASYLAPPQAGFSWWQGMIWFVPSGAANNYGMPGSTSPLQTNHSPILNHDSTGNPDDLHNGRPHSNHPGGFVVTMCDGRAFFMGEDTDYRVYCLLMAPDSPNVTQSPIASPWNYPLNWYTSGLNSTLIPITPADIK